MTRGRPSIRSAELANDICDWIAEGKALASFCRERDIGYSTVITWLGEDEVFQANYTCAREHSGDADADVVSDIRDRCLSGEIDPATARVAIDAAKWSAGIRQPKKYGAKYDITSGGEALKPADTNEQSARLAAILAAAEGRSKLADDAETQ